MIRSDKVDSFATKPPQFKLLFEWAWVKREPDLMLSLLQLTIQRPNKKNCEKHYFWKSQK